MVVVVVVIVVVVGRCVWRGVGRGGGGRRGEEGREGMCREEVGKGEW